MGTGTVFLIVLVVLVLLLAIEVPIGHSLALSGLLGVALQTGVDVGLASMGSAPFESVADYSLTIIPMYILVGMFAMHGRMAEQLFIVLDRVIGRVRGGLGMATVAACAGFAAVTGSSVATAATMSKVSVDEMRARGYPDSIATGIVAAAGTLGILIPPSIILALYGVLTGESIAALLAAGIAPGILSAVVFATYIWIRGPGKAAAKESVAAGSAAAGVGSTDRAGAATTPSATTLSNRDQSAVPIEKIPLRELPWRGPVKILVLFLLVMGGVYTGWFTVTESGALAALFACIMMLIELRKERPRVIFSRMANSLRETAGTTSMSFFVLVGSMVFTFYLVSAGIPTSFSRWVVSLDIPPVIVVALLLAALIPLGMALESLSLLIIVVPLAYPVVTELGFDGIWFAIAFVKLVEIGQIFPPIGINVFVVAGITGVRAERVYRGIMPFVALDLIIVAALFVFPDIALWLPSLIAGD